MNLETEKQQRKSMNKERTDFFENISKIDKPIVRLKKEE